MSMPPQLAAQTCYFQVRVRTHEWAEGQRVSLLDVAGIGQARLRMLYAEDFSTADRIMTAPADEVISRLSGHAPFPGDPAQIATLVHTWRVHLVRLWREQIGEPLPANWRIDRTLAPGACVPSGHRALIRSLPNRPRPRGAIARRTCYHGRCTGSKCHTLSHTCL